MLGTNIAAGMILFTLLGYYLEHKRGTGHFWTLGGMGLGLAYAAYEFWSTLRLLQRLRVGEKPQAGGTGEGQSGETKDA